MKALLLALCLPALLLPAAGAAPAIIPLPISLQEQPGAFAWNASTPITVAPGAAEAASLLRDYFGGLVGPEKTRAPIVFEAAPTLPEEAYELEVTPQGIVLRAASHAGWANAIQTLRQLLPPARIAHPAAGGPLALPCVVIHDAPRSHWRGLMLDCSRHFFTADEVKQVIDTMALHKLNVFHWHLTDNNGWRLEIRKYPRLTSVGAWRGDDPAERVGDFYTQDEVREVVAYAAKRNVTIVPEIEMPGHGMALLTAYPELANGKGPFRVTSELFIGAADTLDVSNPKVYAFLDDVFAETAALFPNGYLHIGGDEVDQRPWQNNPRVQAWMKEKGVPDLDHVQPAFTARILALAQARGRRVICWYNGRAAPMPGAIQMYYNNHPEVLAKLLQAGDDVVLCPDYPLYFDLAYADNSTDKVYAYEPIPEGITPEQARHILGYEAAIWTEHLYTLANIEAQTYPRGCAMAEVFWSPPAARHLDDFHARLKVHLERLKALGISVHKRGSDI
jgi:hexosaminidase